MISALGLLLLELDLVTVDLDHLALEGSARIDRNNLQANRGILLAADHLDDLVELHVHASTNASCP